MSVGASPSRWSLRRVCRSKMLPDCCEPESACRFVVANATLSDAASALAVEDDPTSSAKRPQSAARSVPPAIQLHRSLNLHLAPIRRRTLEHREQDLQHDKYDCECEAYRHGPLEGAQLAFASVLHRLDYDIPPSSRPRLQRRCI